MQAYDCSVIIHFPKTVSVTYIFYFIYLWMTYLQDLNWYLSDIFCVE